MKKLIIFILIAFILTSILTLVFTIQFSRNLGEFSDDDNGDDDNGFYNLLDLNFGIEDEVTPEESFKCKRNVSIIYYYSDYNVKKYCKYLI